MIGEHFREIKEPRITQIQIRRILIRGIRVHQRRYMARYLILPYLRKI